MKRIINGKLYDTDNAEMICEYGYGYQGDFGYVRRSLYKSSGGQFFFEYSGGPMSEYGKQSGPNEKSGSSGIELISETDAKDFIEANGTVEDYVTAFGEPQAG